jgi:hypothetical protein
MGVNKSDAGVQDWELDVVLFDRTVAEWVSRYPFLAQYTMKQRHRRIGKLQATEMMIEKGLEDIEAMSAGGDRLRSLVP